MATWTRHGLLYLAYARITVQVRLTCAAGALACGIMVGTSRVGFLHGSVRMKKLVLGTLLALTAGIQPIFAAPERTLSPAIYAQMKRGNKLGMVWIKPKYDVTTGFVVGKVSSNAAGYFANTVDYIPYAFQRVIIPGSTNVLNMTVVEFSVVDTGTSGIFGATIGIEGQVVDKDGQVMFAFTTREEVNNRETVEKNCQAVIDRIVWSIAKDLGKSFEHALEVRREVETGEMPNASGLVPVRPPAQDRPMTLNVRLLRLEDLKQ